MNPANHVMFLRDAWLRSEAWDGFRERFEAHGFETSAPAWPSEGEPDFAQTTITRLVDHHAALIHAMATPPLLVGHGYGGLVAQLLLDRGLGAGAVAIAPEPIRGVLPNARSLWSALPVLTRWGAWNEVVELPYARFGRDIAQTLGEAARGDAYDRYVMAAPGRIFFQVAFGSGVAISSRPNRAPLLFLAGEEDLTVDPWTVHDAYLTQWNAHPGSLTSFKSFAGASHFAIAGDGFEALADFAMRWATTACAVRGKLRLVGHRTTIESPISKPRSSVNVRKNAFPSRT